VQRVLDGCALSVVLAVYVLLCACVCELHVAADELRAADIDYEAQSGTRLLMLSLRWV
jgi:hypothetical protein